jgi:hypothetical protein
MGCVLLRVAFVQQKLLGTVVVVPRTTHQLSFRIIYAIAVNNVKCNCYFRSQKVVSLDSFGYIFVTLKDSPGAGVLNSCKKISRLLLTLRDLFTLYK